MRLHSIIQHIAILASLTAACSACCCRRSQYRSARRPYHGEELKKFHLPPGFEIQLVAAEPEVRKPINLHLIPAAGFYFTQSVEYPFPASARN